MAVPYESSFPEYLLRALQLVGQLKDSKAEREALAPGRQAQSNLTDAQAQTIRAQLDEIKRRRAAIDALAPQPPEPATLGGVTLPLSPQAQPQAPNQDTLMSALAQGYIDPQTAALLSGKLGLGDIAEGTKVGLGLTPNANTALTVGADLDKLNSLEQQSLLGVIESMRRDYPQGNFSNLPNPQEILKRPSILLDRIPKGAASNATMQATASLIEAVQRRAFMQWQMDNPKQPGGSDDHTHNIVTGLFKSLDEINKLLGDPEKAGQSSDANQQRLLNNRRAIQTAIDSLLGTQFAAEPEPVKQPSLLESWFGQGNSSDPMADLTSDDLAAAIEALGGGKQNYTPATPSKAR